MTSKSLFLCLLLLFLSGCASDNTASSTTYYHWTKQGFNMDSCITDYENCNEKARAWGQGTTVTNTSILKSCMERSGYSALEKASRSAKSETACGNYWK